MISEQERIKRKIISINPKRWWGDDYDVRFYLISNINKIKNKSILDIGGGIGIISSEIPSNNFKINLDLSLEDLKICKKEFCDIQTICASMEYLPFKKETFEVIICSNLLEVAKEMDVKKDNFVDENEIMSFPTINHTINEIHYIMKNNGVLYITTPNNLYYNTTKLTYDELQNVITKNFVDFKIYFFNTFKKFGNSRKTNFANIIPKLKAKIQSPDIIINSLLKSESFKKYSVSFYVKIKK